ncbi:hypothetical protein M9H77_12944 [Catharanthus roseus]|uniref:Uncharacterized protein n=1 Tax=Catharanthus roseus TaxID=4058 RepID=A0ACC0BIW3_CATRO|nr:hypothetical protein M9H77_12944 [Catharanthus roseus]
MVMKVNTYLIVTRYLRSRTSDHRMYVTVACECRGAKKSRTKSRFDEEEEEVPIKRRGPYGTKKYGCPFKLKGDQVATSENWQLVVHDRRHNHAISAYHRGHAQTAILTDEQLIQTEQFRKSHMPLRNMLQFFREQNMDCAVRYVALLYYCTEIIQHPSQDEEKDAGHSRRRFRVQYSTVGGHRDDSDRYIDQNALAKLTEMIKDEETTDQIESEHSVLKLWLSTCHGDLDTVFLNIDFVIEGQIAEIKSSLEYSRLKEKYNAKGIPILKIINNNISHLEMKKIRVELKRAPEIIDDPKNKCGHYLRISHGLPCSCELITR